MQAHFVSRSMTESRPQRRTIPVHQQAGRSKRWRRPEFWLLFIALSSSPGSVSIREEPLCQLQRSREFCANRVSECEIGRLSMRTNWSFWSPRARPSGSLLHQLSRQSPAEAHPGYASTTRRSPFFSSGSAVTTKSLFRRQQLIPAAGPRPLSAHHLAAILLEAAQASVCE